MEKQSVRIGVDRFFYALIDEESESGISYQPTVHLPGVNAVILAANSQINSFYADDGVFETYVVDGDRDMQVSFSGISNDVASVLTGAAYNNGLLVDKKGDSPPYMAIGFRAQKSNGQYRYIWVYKGRFAKADITSYTKSASISPQSDIYVFKAVSRLHDGAWRQMLDSDDTNVPSGVLDNLNSESVGWFSTPDYVPAV